MEGEMVLLAKGSWGDPDGGIRLAWSIVIFAILAVLFVTSPLGRLIKPGVDILHAIFL